MNKRLFIIWILLLICILCIIFYSVNAANTEIITTSLTIIPDYVIIQENHCYLDCCVTIDNNIKYMRCNE
jgi:hypothetical protein